MKPTLPLVLILASTHACGGEELETITVTGYPIDLDLSLASVTIITAEQIQRAAATDIGDILKFHTGLELGRNGGPGQATSLFIRGTESDQNLILIDGVRINSGSVGSAALQNIDPQIIERIEIVKGPRSALWGSGAIGGVINIITHKGVPNQAAYGGSVEAGGDKTLKVSAWAAHNSADWNANISISNQRTNGFPSLQTADEDRGYANTSFKLGGGINLGIHAFELQHWQTRGNNEYFDYFANPLDQDFLNSSSNLNWESQFSQSWRSELDLSYVQDHIDQNQSRDAVHTDRSILSWQNHVQLADHQQLLLGLSSTNEKVDSITGFSPYESDTDQWETWGQYDLNTGAHELIAGLRYLDHDDAGTHLTWSLGYGYSMSAATNLFASAATAFRIPTANERFGFGGNPDLEPEESLSYELGLNHRLGQAHRFKLSVYRNEIDNMIQWVLTAPPFTGYNQNIDQSRIDGIELGYDYQQGPWSVHLGGNWQDPMDRTTDSRLLRRADYSINSRMHYSFGNWQIGGDLLYTGDRDDFGGVTLEAYTLVNLDSSYQLSNSWQLFGKVENLFDEDYELASGYRSQDRIAFLGIRYR
jgi:vitamin B12 transporter